MSDVRRPPSAKSKKADPSAQSFHDDSDLRGTLMLDEEPIKGRSVAVGADEVSEGRIFGLNAVERMVLSIVLFLVVTVMSLALLFATGTIVIR